MIFEEVLPALREGKKVRLARWKKGRYIYVWEGYLVNEYEAVSGLGIDAALYDDWEVVEEPKVVADYVYSTVTEFTDGEYYPVFTYEVGKEPGNAKKIEGTERIEE